MVGTGDDEQLFVVTIFRVRGHVAVGILREVARVGLLTMNHHHGITNLLGKRKQFVDGKAKLLYNSLIISTYKIEKRERVTIWLLLKFPRLP